MTEDIRLSSGVVTDYKHHFSLSGSQDVYHWYGLPQCCRLHLIPQVIVHFGSL